MAFASEEALAHERRRFGYRRLHVLLRREGDLVNHKKLFRLDRERKLTAWLTQTLVDLENRWPNSDVDALMPWNDDA